MEARRLCDRLKYTVGYLARLGHNRRDQLREVRLITARRPAVRYVVTRRAHYYRCRAGRGVLRVGAYGGWSARVVRAGHDERTPPPLLADLDCAVRGSAPFLRVCLGSSVVASPPRHGSTRHGPTSLRTGPSARRCRGSGETPAAGDGGRDPAGMAVPAAHASDGAGRVPGMPGTRPAPQRPGPAISWIGYLTMSSSRDRAGVNRCSAWWSATGTAPAG
jgi:hypothetical protein